MEILAKHVLLLAIYVVHKRPAPHVYMGIMEINALHVYLLVKIVVPQQFVKVVLMGIILFRALVIFAIHHAMIVLVLVFVNHV